MCYQIMKEIENDSNLSPQRKADFRMLANKDTAAPFLAQVFLYTAVQSSGTNGHGISLKDNSVSNIAAINQQKCSSIMLQGISGREYLEDGLLLDRFSNSKIFNKEQYIEPIKGLIEKVQSISVGETKQVLFSAFSLKRPIQIKETTQSLIQDFAHYHLGLQLSGDFFALGDLVEDGVVALFQPRLTGSQEELTKYKLINKLADAIENYLLVEQLKHLFEGVFCIRLALVNKGIRYGEDVRVTLRFPANCLWSPEDFRDISGSKLSFLKYMDDLEKFFCIEATDTYDAYEVSSICDSADFYGFPDYSGAVEALSGGRLPGSTEIDRLRRLFSYRIHKGHEFDVLNLRFDQILNCSAMAFPEVILCKQPMQSVSYSIVAKSMEHPIEGTILIHSNGT